MTTEHPAMAASKASWSAVQRKAKQEWLALFAEDACIEDPIGVSPLDPEGKGQRGKEAIERFWDANIGPNTIEVDMKHSYAAGAEAAHLGTLTVISLPPAPCFRSSARMVTSSIPAGMFTLPR